MTDVLYLAWRYLAYHRIKTVILVASITLIVYLPIGLNLLVEESARQLTARAAATPLLIGAKGSPLELVLSSLYFELDVPPAMRYAEVSRIDQSDLAYSIPLYTRFRTRHSTIVGTSLEYFDFRGLEMARGRTFRMLGECVLGSQAASVADAGPGSTIMSAPDSVFDIAGGYPLKMNVVGVLKPAGTPDDRAVFVDVKTAWVIEGLAHGHDNLTKPGQESRVLQKDENKIVANASVVQYNEITPANVDSFHFHGDPDTFPVTAAIAVPHDEKSSTLLEGRYLGDDELVQIVRPQAVMDELLQTVFTVEGYLILAISVVGVATAVTMVLVFVLSLQLRRREIETMHKIGGSRSRVVSLVTTEIASVLVAGTLLTGVLTWATSLFATAAMTWLIQLT